MAELKILGKTIDEWKESSFPNRLEKLKAKAKPGEIASRVDFSDEKIGPKFKPVKPAKKITKETVTVEGDRGSVDRSNPDVIGPDMSKVNKETSMPKPAREFSAMEMAQNLMSPGYNKKKGGMVKKYKSGGSVSSASKRADGIATKGKTRGKII